jgi:hypothetical protein
LPVNGQSGALIMGESVSVPLFHLLLQCPIRTRLPQVHAVAHTDFIRVTVDEPGERGPLYYGSANIIGV